MKWNRTTSTKDKKAKVNLAVVFGGFKIKYKIL
jgi:hypothetical protein